MTILPEFHDQLYAAAQRQARRRLSRPRIALPRFGTIVLTGLSTAVVIAVAAVLLSAHGVVPSEAPTSKPPSVAKSRTELLQTLAALRTPQTAGSRRIATILMKAPSNQRDQGVPAGRRSARALGGSSFRRRGHTRPNDLPADDAALSRARQAGHVHAPRSADRRALRLAPPPPHSLRPGLPVKRGRATSARGQRLHLRPPPKHRRGRRTRRRDERQAQRIPRDLSRSRRPGLDPRSHRVRPRQHRPLPRRRPDRDDPRRTSRRRCERHVQHRR